MITIDGNQITWHPGITLDRVVAALEESHIYAVVRVNGKLVSRPNFSATLVEDGARIEPLPLIAGG